MNTSSSPTASPFGWTTTPSGLTLAGVLRTLVRTDADLAPLLLRVVLGLVMFPHGAQKVLGWFGGYGFSGTMGYLTGTIGLPFAIALLVLAAEFLGAIALVAGLAGRVAALGIGAVMTGAVLTVHLPFGFFMNWSGQQGGEGFEYHLLVLAMVAVLVVKGSGALSLDRWLARRAVA